MKKPDRRKMGWTAALAALHGRHGAGGSVCLGIWYVSQRCAPDPALRLPCHNRLSFRRQKARKWGNRLNELTIGRLCANLINSIWKGNEEESIRGNALQRSFHSV